MFAVWKGTSIRLAFIPTDRSLVTLFRVIEVDGKVEQPVGL